MTVQLFEASSVVLSSSTSFKPGSNEFVFYYTWIPIVSFLSFPFLVCLSSCASSGCGLTQIPSQHAAPRRHSAKPPSAPSCSRPQPAQCRHTNNTPHTHPHCTREHTSCTRVYPSSPPLVRRRTAPHRIPHPHFPARHDEPEPTSSCFEGDRPCFTRSRPDGRAKPTHHRSENRAAGVPASLLHHPEGEEGAVRGVQDA